MVVGQEGLITIPFCFNSCYCCENECQCPVGRKIAECCVYVIQAGFVEIEVSAYVTPRLGMKSSETAAFYHRAFERMQHDRGISKPTMWRDDLV